jgi:predicted esterase
LALHGAGLEADNGMVTGALDPVSNLCAYVLFPTGVTPWSGDDWHNWGFSDVEAAIAAIPAWIETVGWKGSNVDIHRWIVSGHSNGGQGTWYALTHRPDKIVAAAPVSGYASIQKYVPYELWQPADPRRIAVVGASLNSYRHEMLMANAKGIPVQQQHGEIDDNVPSYNSRLLAQQLQLAGANSSYNEVPDKNHWYDGVMTTPALTDFYHSQTRNNVVLPRELEEFALVVGDPGDTGSKGGIRVLQLDDPGQYGKVRVKGHVIRTSNVISLEFDPTLWKATVSVDGQEINLANMLTGTDARIKLFRIGTSWATGAIRENTETAQRHGRQLGSMTAILRSQGSFIIRHPGFANTRHMALQISRNLHQYFQADASIHASYSDPTTLNASGNIISLAVSADVSASSPNFPLRVGTTGVSVQGHRGRVQDYGDMVRGAAFLRPAGGERLELVIWGADDEGLRQAARVVPMLTGVGQPDFVVFGGSAKWRGIEGVLAMGFFDSEWKVTVSSVVELE